MCEGAGVFDDDPLKAVVVLPIIRYDVDGGGENVKARVVWAIAVVGTCEGLAGWAGEDGINKGECEAISDITAEDISDYDIRSINRTKSSHKVGGIFRSNADFVCPMGISCRGRPRSQAIADEADS